MAKIGTWKIHPVKNEIILTLIRHKGEMLDTDLLRILQNQYVDINKSILSRILFNLEVQMLIDVQRLRKNVASAVPGFKLDVSIDAVTSSVPSGTASVPPALSRVSQGTSGLSATV